MESENTALSPRELIDKIINFLDYNDLAYAIITVLVIALLYYAITIVKMKRFASWKVLALSIFCICGWTFFMSVVIWPKMEAALIVSLSMLIGATISAFTGIYFFFLKTNEQGQAHIWNTIILGTIAAVAVFTMLGFAAFDQTTYSVSIFMGLFLGFFLAVFGFSIKNMEADATKEKDKWDNLQDI